MLGLLGTAERLLLSVPELGGTQEWPDSPRRYAVEIFLRPPLLMIPHRADAWESARESDCVPGYALFNAGANFQELCASQ